MAIICGYISALCPPLITGSGLSWLFKNGQEEGDAKSKHNQDLWIQKGWELMLSESKPQWIDSGQHPNPTQLNLFPNPSESPLGEESSNVYATYTSLHQSIKNYYYWNKQTVSYLLLGCCVLFKHFKYYRISSFRYPENSKKLTSYRKHRLGCSFHGPWVSHFSLPSSRHAQKWKGFKLLVGTGSIDLS